MEIEITKIVFDSEPDEATRKAFEKAFKKLWKANNIKENFSTAYKHSLCYGRAIVEIENTKEK